MLRPAESLNLNVIERIRNELRVVVLKIYNNEDLLKQFLMNV